MLQDRTVWQGELALHDRDPKPAAPLSKRALATKRLREEYSRQTAALVDIENRAAKVDHTLREQERREAEGNRERLHYRKRRKELRQLIAVRHGFGITDLDEHAHVDVAVLAAHCLASPYRNKAVDAVREYCGKCSTHTVETIMRRARGILPRRAHMSAAAVGLRMRVTVDEREGLRLTTIRAAFETPQEAAERQCERRRVAQAARRQRERQDTSERVCEACAKPIPHGRTTRRFCGDTCKKRAQRLSTQGRSARLSPEGQFHVVPLSEADQEAKLPYWETTVSGTLSPHNSLGVIPVGHARLLSSPSAATSPQRRVPIKAQPPGRAPLATATRSRWMLPWAERQHEHAFAPHGGLQ
jgi:hypothetical protein